MSNTERLFKYYGKLEVIEDAGRNKYGKKVVKCLCDCGNYTLPELSHLHKGGVKSCSKCSETTFALCTVEDINYYVGMTAQGDLFTFDLDDINIISKYSWSLSSTKYMETSTNKGSSKILLHRLLTKCPKGKFVDHADGNTLNFRRSNLRVCTQQQNNFNTRKRVGTTSKYKGVCFSTQRQKYRARINFNGKEFHLGFFEEEDNAALAYNEKAKELFGEFAWLNEVLPIE